MNGMIQDARHALRLYGRTPGASVMVILLLAVGLAFVSAFLSLYSDLILRPEPGFEPGGRVVSIECYCGSGGLPYDQIERITNDATTIDHVAGISSRAFQIGVERVPVFGELVTRDFFPGLKPRLALGRGFSSSEHDPDGEPVVVISWRYWQEQFEGQSDVLGKTLQIDAAGDGRGPSPQPGAEGSALREYRIVGVMDRKFTGTSRNDTALWIPVERGMWIGMSVPAQIRAQILRRLSMRAAARRNPKVSNAAVLNELRSRFADHESMKQPGAQFQVIDNITQDVTTQREVQRQLRLFLAASVLLALVASANVSLFLLARAPARRRELGIRMAVGAPVRRLLRQLACEAALLVCAAAALGLVLSVWLAKILGAMSFLQFARWHNVTLFDWRVLGLMGAFLMLVTLLVSLAPMLGLKKMGIAASSRLIAARATVAQRFAGTAQIAVAGALGGAAIAFAWHLISMLLTHPGYNTESIYVAGYSANPQGRRAQVRNGMMVRTDIADITRMRDAFKTIPGLNEVSLAVAVPGKNMGGGVVSLPDPQKPQESVGVQSLIIDSNYMKLLGMQLVEGRNIQDSDDAVLVNQTFARRFFGRADVSGETLPVQSTNTNAGGTGNEGIQIAGVVKDVSYQHPLAAIQPMMFATNGMPMAGVVIVKSSVSPSALQRLFAEKARDLDLQLTSELVPLAKVRTDNLAPDRARGSLTILAAALVVLSAAFGFYGTQRYIVMAGRREYAIRSSLGAGPRALGRLVMWRGLLMGAPGFVLGVPLAFIVVGWLRGSYVSDAVSPVLIAFLVCAGMVALVVLASLGPALVARSTQPASLLRQN
jgi:putative ABC transport system permease protein